MTVRNLSNWKRVLRNLIDSDQNAERCVQWICSAFKVSRADVAREWNNIECKRHGI